MKLQENMITKQNALVTENKEITAQLDGIDKKLENLKDKNKHLHSTVLVAENTLNV